MNKPVDVLYEVMCNAIAFSDKPVGWCITRLPPEKREALRQLKSDDIKNVRPLLEPNRK